MPVGMHTMRRQRIKLSLLALGGARQCFTELCTCYRIAPPGTYVSQLESKEWGTPAVTPKDIFPVDELMLGLGLGEKNQDIFILNSRMVLSLSY